MSSNNLNPEENGKLKGSAYQIREFIKNSTIEGIDNITWIAPVSTKIEIAKTDINRHQTKDFSELCDNRFYEAIKQIFNKEARSEFKNYWPTRGGPHWDAVGYYEGNDKELRLLLVEAKSHKGETHSKCKATDEKSIRIIDNTLTECIKNLVTQQDSKYYLELWTGKYYQVANRIAFREKLNLIGVKTTLLFIYFINDPTHTKKYGFFKEDTAKGYYESIIEEMGLKEAINGMDIRYMQVEATGKSDG